MRCGVGKVEGERLLRGAFRVVGDEAGGVIIERIRVIILGG
jgi:hypothetical protein